MDRRQKIIADLYNSKDLNDALEKMNPPELREDLKQELFVILCDMNSEKLFEIYNRGELRYYTVRIMLNLIMSKTSTFYYKFRKHLECIISLPIGNMEDTEEGRKYKVDVRDATRSVYDKTLEEEEQEFEIFIHNVKIHINNLTWYEQGLFTLYVDNNRNASKLSKETGIPIRSIYHTLNLIKTKIKEAV